MIEVSMRIAHIVSTFPPYKGGMGNVACEIAERTAKRGHEVVVVTPERRITNNESRITDRGRSHNSLFIIHYSSPRLWFGNAAWCPNIHRELEQLQPDIVHLHWPFIGGSAPVFAWRRCDARYSNYSPIRTNKRIDEPQRRLIVQYHMNLLAPGWRGVAFALYERWAIPRMVRATDRIVVSSLDYTQRGTLAPYAEELEGRIIEIPLGVDVERFVPYGHPPTPPSDGHRSWETKNFSPSHRERFSPFLKGGARGGARADAQGEREGVGLRVLFVGGLDHAHAFKGVPTLIEAIARVPSARLQIVGDGDLRPTYERQARALGVADRVVFLGSVPNVKLPEVYRNADVLVLPSTARSEAFGLVLLEAMASGIATIASNLPGVRTVIVDGETGFLVPPGDAGALAERIERFVRDPGLARRMGAVGRTRAETTYAWDGIIERWNGLYASCASS